MYLTPIEQAFNHFFQGDIAQLNREQVTFTPRVNVVDGEKTIRVSAELPGVDEKDIQVNLTGDGLTISGEKQQEQEDLGKGYYRLERSFGSFKRVIALPDEVDRENVQASFKKGVLTVTVPKLADRTPKKIDVRAE